MFPFDVFQSLLHTYDDSDEVWEPFLRDESPAVTTDLHAVRSARRDDSQAA